MEIPVIQRFLISQLRQSLRTLNPNLQVDLEIPLHPISGNLPMIYRSAIAFRLTTQFHQPAITIASKFVTQLHHHATDPHWQSPQDFRLQVMPPGNIQFEWTDIGIAKWLQRMTQVSFPQTETQPIEQFPDILFPIQYSHARCCSLLRLAQRDRIMAFTLSHPTPTPQPGQLSPLEPISWLNPQQQLQLTHPAEQTLIAQLIATVDTCFSGSQPPQWPQLAHRLSQAFQTFYSQCRIWGSIKDNTPERAQVRLGLVLITQSVLQFLLQEKLNLIAPLEL